MILFRSKPKREYDHSPEIVRIFLKADRSRRSITLDEEWDAWIWSNEGRRHKLLYTQIFTEEAPSEEMWGNIKKYITERKAIENLPSDEEIKSACDSQRRALEGSTKRVTIWEWLASRMGFKKKTKGRGFRKDKNGYSGIR